MIDRCDYNDYNINRIFKKHRRRFESARHFIPQTAPRLVPQDKEESCIYAIDRDIEVSV